MANLAPVPRILFLGMPGIFSQTVLEALLVAQAPICAVLLPAPAKSAPPVVQRHPPLINLFVAQELPLLTPFVAQTTLQLAWQHNLPVYEVSRLQAIPVQELIRTLAPACACVACFSKRIPATLLTIPPLGFLNVHPSLLPDYRGPAPLFWQLRNGAPHSGVTVHWMDENLDTGDIAEQAPLHLPDGIAGPKADELCAKAGGELLVKVLKALADGETLRRPQPAGGTYQPWPQAADFTLSTDWSARHAFNFMRGTAEWQQPYPITVASEQFLLAAALSYTPRDTLAQPFMLDGETIHIQLTPGVLHAQRFGTGV
ncbi:MAG: formyltransferase family protein [Caldilineaceae bacterium]